jgi:hypothetical protein
LRNYPQLNQQLGQAATVDYDDATGVDTASVDEVVLGAIGSRGPLGTAATVAYDRATG